MLGNQSIYFWGKAIVISIVGFVLFQTLLVSSYRFAFETQSVLKCLPQTLWLIDDNVQSSKIQKGSLVRVSTKHYQDFYPPGTSLMKLIVAVEGDEVTIEDGLMSINGQFFGTLPLAKSRPAAFIGTYVLNKNEIWLSGSSETTLDSRYIGPVNIQEVEAHAYALL